RNSMRCAARSTRYTLMGRRRKGWSSPLGGQARWKNCPGCAVRAMGGALSTRCLYSALTHSLLTTSHSISADLNVGAAEQEEESADAGGLVRGGQVDAFIVGVNLVWIYRYVWLLLLYVC